MSESVAILGTGPSFKLFGKINNYRAVIYTNSLLDQLYDNVGNRNTKSYYVAHDKRLYSTDFLEKIRLLQQSHVEVKLGGDLFKLVGKYNICDLIYKNNLAIELFEDFSSSSDLERNVVTDFCIPFSVSLGFKNIELFGCDFNYNLSSMNSTPNYIKQPIGDFDHTVDTSKKWSNLSNQKYMKAKKYLLNYEINIKRYTI